MDDPNAHASTILSLIGLGALAIGTLAMFLRWLSTLLSTGHAPSIRAIGNGIRTDVQQGRGFVETGRALRGEPPRYRQTVYTSRRAPRGFMSSRTQRRLRTPRTNEENARSSLPDARSGDVQRSAFSVQGDDLLLPSSPDELYRLVTAIRHKDKGATKQQAIEVAWGIKKGGSAAWRRASALFDAATEPPTRYPQRTPAQEAAREELGLPVK